MTIWPLKRLLANIRLRISSQKARYFHVPQYEGLSIQDMLDWSAGYKDVARALPIDKIDIMKLHRDYISTIIYTLVG